MIDYTEGSSKQYHIGVGKEDVGEYVILPGDPGRCHKIAKYFDKGNLISLEGRIQTGSYDDKDGNKRYTTDVALENFEFVESKNARAQSSANFDYIPEPTPYDYQNDNNKSNNVDVANDPFAEFGDSVTIDDNFLD